MHHTCYKNGALIVVHFSYNFNDINIFTHASVTKNVT